MKQLVINGKKSYDDFGVCIATRKISQPKKKSIKGSVPFSNITYDFSKIDGEIYWEERTLTYTFDIAEFTTEEMEELKENLLDWLLNVHDADIYDPYIPNYHFHGSFDSDSWDEDFGAGTLGISFTVYPYKIANDDTSNKVDEIGISKNGVIEGNYNIVGMKIDGKSVQDGVPTPETPIEIVSLGDNGEIKIISINGDGSQETTSSVELGVPLRSLPNGTKDRIYKKNGCWYHEQNVKQIILDGHEGYSMNENGVKKAFVIHVLDISSTPYDDNATGYVISDKLKTGNEKWYWSSDNTDTNYITAHHSQKLLYIVTNIAENVGEFNDWLLKNPIKVLYQMENPVLTEITNESVLNTLNNIPTYNNITNIIIDSELQTTFEIYYNETKRVSIHNVSSHRISPKIIVDGNFTVTINNTSFTINSGTYENTEFYLESGLNEVSISGYGSITFSYKGEKF